MFILGWFAHFSLRKSKRHDVRNRLMDEWVFKSREPIVCVKIKCRNMGYSNFVEWLDGEIMFQAL